MKKAARKIVCHHFNEVCEILYYFSASNIFDSSPNKYRSFFAALFKSETFVIVTALQNNKCLLYLNIKYFVASLISNHALWFTHGLFYPLLKCSRLRDEAQRLFNCVQSPAQHLEQITVSSWSCRKHVARRTELTLLEFGHSVQINTSVLQERSPVKFSRCPLILLLRFHPCLKVN